MLVAICQFIYLFTIRFFNCPSGTTFCVVCDVLPIFENMGYSICIPSLLDVFVQLAFIVPTETICL